MKNLLLLSTMAMFATGASAQNAALRMKEASANVVPAQRTASMKLDYQRPAMEVRTKAAKLDAKAQKVRRRTAATGLYYSRPVGTYLMGFTLEGRGSWEEIVCCPPMTALEFINHSDVPKATNWTIMNTDLAELTDANNNLMWSCDPGAMYYPIALNDRLGESYILAQNYNAQYLDPNRTFDDPSRIASLTYPMYMGAYSAHSNVAYSLGAMESSYLFGTGSINFTEKSGQVPGLYEMKGVITEYDKPASPLYVEDFYTEITTFYEEPIPEDVEITAVVRNAETEEVIATLTASSADLYSLGEQPFGDSPTGNIYWYLLDFTQYTKGILGGLVKKPFVIDCPYTIEITGFNQEGVEFGFCGGKNGKGNEDEENPVWEEPVRDTYAMFVNGDGEKFTHAIYGSGWDGVTINLQLNALFDHIEVLVNSEGVDENNEPMTFNHLNEIEVSADGNDYVNHGDPTSPGAYLYTACPWFDEELGTPNYTAELPSWVLTIEADDSLWEQYRGLCQVAFTAEPLPADVKGRGALVYVKGRGVVAPEPLFVYQGDYETALQDIPAGINTVLAPVTASTGTFNLAGQRVNASHKGLLIKDGKKVIK